MKKSIKHRMIAMALAAMMTAAPVGGTVFAADAITPDQPDKPVVTSYEDNDKIEDYNRKVDEYNKAAQNYNDSVDKEYEAAVEETNRKNAEIDQLNEAEAQRVAAAEERNAEAQRAADEENAAIATENAENKKSVDAHNDEEDAKVRESEEKRAAALAENEKAIAHNEEVDKYNADLEQYKKDLEQYNIDKGYEAQILALKYPSVDAYNQMIETYYNKPAREAESKNKSAEAIDAKDLYTVKEAEVKSGRTVKVHIEHYFIDIDKTITEDFEIDENDTLISKSFGSAATSTQPGYASFYYNTDEAHTKGYWMSAGDVMMDTANYKNTGWDCGTVHEISYKDGKRHAGDSTDIDIYYDYMWMSLKMYKTFNNPVLPTAPVAPESLEKKDLVDVPEVYTANYMKYEEKAGVQAVLENIKAANFIERLAAPEKGEYIALLSYMALFDVPEMTIPAVAEAATHMIPAAQTEAQTTHIAEQEAPMASAPVEIAEVAEIADSEAPLAANNTWALINLIMAIITGLTSAVLFAGYFGKKEDDEDAEDDEAETKRRGLVRLASLIPAIGSVIAFILTENMNYTMALTDRWTILMAVILLAQAVIAILAKKGTKEDDKTAEAINA